MLLKFILSPFNSLFVTAELMPQGSGNNQTVMDATAVFLEGGQTLEEILSVLLCPLATDMKTVLKALELADGGPRSCFDESSDNPCLFTLTALQVIVCLLARYHPSVLQLPVAERAPPPKSEFQATKPNFQAKISPVEMSSRNTAFH